MINILFFQSRTRFIRSFYDDASLPFRNRRLAIEAGSPPYDNPPCDSDEPPFQAEWAAAKESLEVLGLMCVSMLSGSLQVYFRAWEAEMGVGWKKREREDLLRQEGLSGYLHYLEHDFLKVPSGHCPAKLDLLEEVTLARNASQHPDKINQLVPEHRKSDLEKHPVPFFMTEEDSTFLTGELADIPFLVPRIRVSREHLFQVVDEAETLAMWLNTYLVMGARR